MSEELTPYARTSPVSVGLKINAEALAVIRRRGATSPMPDAEADGLFVIHVDAEVAALLQKVDADPSVAILEIDRLGMGRS